MRITGNKIKHLTQFFFSELNGIYEQPEIASMARIAMHHFTGLDATALIRRAEENINQSDLLKIYHCVKALKNKVPLQYILREAEFHHLKLFVDEHVLIPRPETEELVEIIMAENGEAKSFLDIGTGSGCIPVTIKQHIPGAQVYGCDISRAALKVAEKNAELNGTLIYFFEADILQPDALSSVKEQFEVIVSNPPYIMEGEKSSIASHVLEHEPHEALFVQGKDPVLFYRSIINHCAEKLKPSGRLYFELNPLTASQVMKHAEDSLLFGEQHLIKDMSGTDRFFKAVKKISL
jgi:release factor glutamine methyltransferase